MNSFPQTLRVCFILDTPNLSTGVATAGLPARIVSLAASLQKAGADISFVLGDRGMTVDAVKSWEFPSLLVNPHMLYGSAEFLVPHLKALHPDFIVIADPQLTAINGRIWAQKIGARLIYEAHDNEGQLARDRGDGEDGACSCEAWQRAAALSADFVTVLTEREARMMETFGIPKHKLLVAPIGIELSERTVWGPDFKARRLLMIGNLFYEPNAIAARFMVDLVREMNARGIEVTARIVGRGPAELVACNSPRVEFLGAVAELDPHLSGVTLALAPITFGSGQKKKLLDFLAAGLPVLATTEAVNGYPEGHPGVVVNDCLDMWADEIERLFANESLLRRMSTEGRNTLFPTFDCLFIAEQALQCYRRWLQMPLCKSLVVLPTGSSEPAWLLEHASQFGIGGPSLTAENPVITIAGKRCQ